MSRLCITFGIIAFLSALTILGLLRMSDPEVFFDNGTDNFSVFGSAPVVETEVSSSMKTVHFFTQLLYTITPVFTSVIAFSLGVLRSQYRFLLGIQKLENRRAKLEDEYLTVQNSLIMNDFNDENNSKTEMQFKNILDEVDNLNQLMKHEVRNIYIDECDSILDRHEAGNLPVTASPEYIPQFVETNINTNPNLPPGNGADFDTYTDDNEEDVFIGYDISHTKKHSELVAGEIDQEVRAIIEKCYAKAKEIILKYEDVLHKSAELLVEKEKIGREEFEALFEGHTITEDVDVEL